MDVEQRRYVHRVRSFQFPRPTLLLPLAGAAGTLALAMVFGAAVTTSLYPQGNSLLGSQLATWSEPTRFVIATVAFINGLLAVLATAGFLRKAWTMLCVRLGLHPVVESEGPCQVIQDSSGRWGLEMILDQRGSHGVLRDTSSSWPPALLGPATYRGGDSPHLGSDGRDEDAFEEPQADTHWLTGGTDCWLPPESSRGLHDVCSYRLLFPLDEAAVARVSRTFDPMEPLEIRWLDLPDSAGGPTLLSIQAAAREEAVLPSSEVETQLRAA